MDNRGVVGGKDRCRQSRQGGGGGAYASMMGMDRKTELPDTNGIDSTSQLSDTKH